MHSDAIVPERSTYSTPPSQWERRPKRAGTTCRAGRALGAVAYGARSRCAAHDGARAVARAAPRRAVAAHASRGFGARAARFWRTFGAVDAHFWRTKTDKNRAVTAPLAHSRASLAQSRAVWRSVARLAHPFRRAERSVRACAVVASN